MINVIVASSALRLAKFRIKVKILDPLDFFVWDIMKSTENMQRVKISKHNPKDYITFIAVIIIANILLCVTFYLLHANKNSTGLFHLSVTLVDKKGEYLNQAASQ